MHQLLTRAMAPVQCPGSTLASDPRALVSPPPPNPQPSAARLHCRIARITPKMALLRFLFLAYRLLHRWRVVAPNAQLNRPNQPTQQGSSSGCPPAHAARVCKGKASRYTQNSVNSTRSEQRTLFPSHIHELLMRPARRCAASGRVRTHTHTPAHARLHMHTHMRTQCHADG